MDFGMLMHIGLLKVGTLRDRKKLELKILCPRYRAEWPIVMSVSVYLSYCLHASVSRTSPNHMSKFHQIFCVMTCGRDSASSAGVALRYALPVLWITWCLHITVRNRRRENERILKVSHQGLHRTAGSESDIYWLVKMIGHGATAWHPWNAAMSTCIYSGRVFLCYW